MAIVEKRPLQVFCRVLWLFPGLFRQGVDGAVAEGYIQVVPPGELAGKILSRLLDGLKLFSRRAALEIFARATIRGFAFDVEVFKRQFGDYVAGALEGARILNGGGAG